MPRMPRIRRTAARAGADAVVVTVVAAGVVVVSVGAAAGGAAVNARADAVRVVPAKAAAGVAGMAQTLMRRTMAVVAERRRRSKRECAAARGRLGRAERN